AVLVCLQTSFVLQYRSVGKPVLFYNASLSLQTGFLSRYGIAEGNQPPNGRMDIVERAGSLPGVSCTHFYEITYTFPPGVQQVRECVFCGKVFMVWNLNLEIPCNGMRCVHTFPPWRATGARIRVLW